MQWIMATIDFHKKTIEIIDAFGMNGKKVAEIMGISYITFKMKSSPKNQVNFFTENNYKKLVDFLKTETEKLNKKDS